MELWVYDFTYCGLNLGGRKYYAHAGEFKYWCPRLLRTYRWTFNKTLIISVVCCWFLSFRACVRRRVGFQQDFNEINNIPLVWACVRGRIQICVSEMLRVCSRLPCNQKKNCSSRWSWIWLKAQDKCTIFPEKKGQFHNHIFYFLWPKNRTSKVQTSNEFDGSKRSTEHGHELYIKQDIMEGLY